ncbi:hypothetical protein RKD44_006576 [Streptomyces collinus]
MPRPATRRRVGRSSDRATSDRAMPHSGEVALQMPASDDGMVSSEKANRENGSALRRNPATVRCTHVHAPRGSRSRFTAIAAATTAVPNASRPSVTWNGAKLSVPTFMKRKLKPQTRERTPKRSRQSRTRRAGEGTEGDAALLLMQATMRQ